jgi:diadenosine tetraphosphate (Ap4A) HIT family hydrolase
LIIFKDEHIYIDTHDSSIPWLKIFTVKEYKEFSECDKDTRIRIIDALDVIEKLMIEYFAPDKINIASFGNYLPKVHFHIQARFVNDNYFPESMWGIKQRDSNLILPDFDIFYELLKKSL